MTPMLDCDAVRMRAVREHLAVCARCYPQFEFERTFLEVLARAQREHSDPERVRARVMTALRAEGFAAA
jgi:hypothetical protein